MSGTVPFWHRPVWAVVNSFTEGLPAHGSSGFLSKIRLVHINQTPYLVPLFSIVDPRDLQVVEPDAARTIDLEANAKL